MTARLVLVLVAGAAWLGLYRLFPLLVPVVAYGLVALVLAGVVSDLAYASEDRRVAEDRWKRWER